MPDPGPGEAQRGLWLAVAPVWGAEASRAEQLWGSAECVGATHASPRQRPGCLKTRERESGRPVGCSGSRVGGRIEVGERIDLSVEGERTTQGGGAAHQVSLYGYLGW